MLGLGVGDGVETSHAHNLPDGVAASIIGVGVGAQNATEICLKPEIVGGLPLLAPLVDAVALDGSGDGNVYAHVEARKSIIAAVEALDYLVGGGLAMVLVGEGVDVGGQAGGGGGVYAGDMVIDARLPARVPKILFQEVDKIGGP